jgi:hypothetical protein
MYGYEKLKNIEQESCAEEFTETIQQQGRGEGIDLDS